MSDLRKTIDDMFKALRRMMKSKNWPGVAAIVGLEVNRAEDDKAHPHFHCSVAVKPGYYNGDHYLSEKRWSEEWTKMMGSQHDLKVDVENEDDEEAGDYLEYSQKPPRENEILWRMKARSQMRRVQRVRYYGEIKKHVSRSKKIQETYVDTEEGNGQSEEKTKGRSFDVVTYRHGNDGDWRVSMGKSLAK